LVSSNQSNYFENATAWSNRTQKTTVATQLNSLQPIDIKENIFLDMIWRFRDHFSLFHCNIEISDVKTVSKNLSKTVESSDFKNAISTLWHSMLRSRLLSTSVCLSLWYVWSVTVFFHSNYNGTNINNNNNNDDYKAISDNATWDTAVMDVFYAHKDRS